MPVSDSTIEPSDEHRQKTNQRTLNQENTRSVSRRQFLMTSVVATALTGLPHASRTSAARAGPATSQPHLGSAPATQDARTYVLPGPGPDAVDIDDQGDLGSLDELTDDQRSGLDAHTKALQRELEATFDRLEDRPSHQTINVQDDLDVTVHPARDLNVDQSHDLDPDDPIYRLQADDIDLTSGTTVELPPGTYTIPTTLQGSVDNWTLRGTGDSPQDVRLITRGQNKRLIEIHGGSNIRVENLTIHNGTDGEHAVGIRIDGTGGILTKDIHHTGLSPREGNTGNHEQFNRQENSLYITVSQSDGVAITDGFVKKSPTEVSGHAENDPIFTAYASHRGIWYVRNSVAMHAGGDGATYASRTRGGIRFTNCVFKNNYASSIRLGGGQSWVRNCTVICDHQQATGIDLLSPTATHMSPIVWEAGGVYEGARSRTGGLIENTRVELRSVPAGQTRGCIGIDGSSGGVIVRNCQLINSTESPSVAVDAPGSSFMNDYQIPAEPHGIYLENLQLSGDGTGPAIAASGRRVLAQGICISMPNGGAVRGARFLDGGPQRSSCSFVSTPDRPALYQQLLSLQQGVPTAGQGIGATGFEIPGLSNLIDGISTVVIMAATLLLVFGLLIIGFIVLISAGGIFAVKRLVS